MCIFEPYLSPISWRISLAVEIAVRRCRFTCFLSSPDCLYRKPLVFRFFDLCKSHRAFLTETLYTTGSKEIHKNVEETNLAVSMDRTASSSADDVTMDTIVTIYDSLIKDLEGAVQEDSGWASRDYDIADSLYDALLDLAHWMDSVALIANVENPSKNSTTRRSDIVSKFFNQLGEKESFLSGTIRFYLREALQNLQALELAFVNGLVNSR